MYIDESYGLKSKYICDPSYELSSLGIIHVTLTLNSYISLGVRYDPSVMKSLSLGVKYDPYQVLSHEMYNMPPSTMTYL